MISVGNQSSKKGVRKFLSIRNYGIFFGICLISAFVFLTSLVRTNIVLNSVLKGENLSFLLIVSDEDIPVVSEAVLFNPEMKRLALIDVPKEAGDVLPSLERSDRFGMLYREKGVEAYRQVLEELLNLEFLFVLDLRVEALGELVDLIEGVEFYLMNPIDITDEAGERYVFLERNQILDGSQIQKFLHMPMDSAEIQEILNQRNIRLVRDLLLRMVRELQTYPAHEEEYLERYYSFFSTGLSKRGFDTLFERLVDIEIDELEVISQDYLGQTRVVQNVSINFPSYNGGVIRDQVARINVRLKSPASNDGSHSVSIDILNGTTVPKLARKTQMLYESYGFNVVNIGNASRDDYEKTVVLNLHARFIEDVRKVAALINCDNIEIQPIPGGDQNRAEVRIILGADFDGKQVVEN